MKVARKIFLTLAVSASVFGIMILYYYLKSGNYPVEETKSLIVVALLIGANTAFIVPIIQRKVDKMASSNH
mgnify:CR=1 FL=1